MAAVARKLNWRGFAKANEDVYAKNKYRWNCFVATFFSIALLLFLINVTVLRSIMFNNAAEIRRYKYEYQQCIQLPHSQVDDCIYGIKGITQASVIPLLVILTPFAAVAGVMVQLLAIYVVMLRYNMRKKLNIKTMQCFEACGDVGGTFEDLVCLTSCGPCTLSQMQEQVNVDVAYCCSGQDPGHSDSNLIV